jgi:hypothetical protein
VQGPAPNHVPMEGAARGGCPDGPIHPGPANAQAPAPGPNARLASTLNYGAGGRQAGPGTMHHCTGPTQRQPGTQPAAEKWPAVQTSDLHRLDPVCCKMAQRPERGLATYSELLN